MCYCPVLVSLDALFNDCKLIRSDITIHLKYLYRLDCNNQAHNRTFMTVGNFKELIGYACTTLRLSHADIKEKFADFPMCIMDYIENGELDKSIEIRFDGLNAALTALFDKENICNFIILHPDEVGDTEPLISYLIDNCNYDFIKHWWTLSNCYMKIREEENGIIFTFRY